MRIIRIRTKLSMIHLWITLVFILVLITSITGSGLLYPYESEFRKIHSLDGIWNFRLAATNDSEVGHREKWYEQELKQTGPIIPMPVPSSYNDITVDKSIRDHVGVVWYDRNFYVSKDWNSECMKIWLRFGSVHYAAQVYVNGISVVNHTGGHIPFQAEVTSVLKYGSRNLISVAVNNTLTDITVPQGQLINLETDEGEKLVQTYTFDFFNYAGIHRPVVLYTTPSTYIDDISVTTDFIVDEGMINYAVTVDGSSTGNVEVYINLQDQDGKYVFHNITNPTGSLVIPAAKLWWPYLMSPDPGYLYTLEVFLKTEGEEMIDVYRLPVGIRKLEWDNNTMTINGKPIYMRGFGRHEDSDIRGKGHDFPLIARDYNLIKWLGANAYRTSHYPYSEEIMDFADREGIMIIDECPGVNIGAFGFKPELLEAHKNALSELYLRDKNRPSVIMWSVANEARTTKKGAAAYFSKIAEHMKSLDTFRPITMAINSDCDKDLAGQYMDVIAFNRYNGWYEDGGRTDTIIINLRQEAHKWHEKHNKPVMITEYGAGAMAGLHFVPDFIWSEEYQTELFSKHFKAFDLLRGDGFFIGEMIWNFADFMTAQGITRVGGNRKGIFTRNRQPKSSAFLTRMRYWILAQELDNATPPSNLEGYVCSAPEHYTRDFEGQSEEYTVVSVGNDI